MFGGLVRAALRCMVVAAVACALGVVASAQDLSSYLGKRIHRVDIEFANGLKIDGGEFRQFVERSVRAGNELSEEEVHVSIERLMSAGLASKVAVAVAVDGDGVVVTYRITRLVRVASVKFGALSTTATEGIRAQLTGLDIGSVLTEGVLDRAADEIVRYYQERGYFDAQVKRTVVVDDTGSRATVDFAIEQGEPTRVSTFMVSRDPSVLPDLEAKLTLKEGERYTAAALEADLVTIRKAMLDAGYLSPEVGEPEVERNPAGNTVAISVSVIAGPRVTVAVEGVKIDQKHLRTLLPIYTDGGLDEFQLSEGDRRLADELQREGYFFARITHRVDNGPSANSRIVTYTVDRGRRFKITDIEIEGTTAVTYAQLRDELQTQEAGFIVLARGLTSRSILQRDSDFIEGRLHAIGYRQARVVQRRQGVLADSDDLVITFVVEEGPRTRIADVAFRGNQVFSTSELLAEPSAKSGDWYSDASISGDSRAMLQKYASAGYITAEITPQIVDIDSTSVRVIYVVSEGLRAFIGNVSIVGNTTTGTRSISRYVEFKQGEILRLDALRKTERQLYETGAFRQVLIRSEPAGTMPDGLSEMRNVYIELEEARPWLIVYGGGFNTDDGPRGLFEISNANLFGRLNTGSLRVRMSPKVQIAELSYSNPRPFGWDLPGLLQLRYDRDVMDAFTSTTYAVIAQLQKRLSDQSGFFFRYNFERVRTSNLDLSPDQIAREDRPVTLGKLSTVYYRDYRNSPFDPDGGTFISLEGTIASTVLGGSERYVMGRAEYQRYDKLPRYPSLVYAGAAKLGLAAPYGESTEIPISQRFFSGGSRTLRGFKFEEAGPRDPVTNQPVGGNLLIVINNELRFPILRRLGGAVFSDTGNVFKKVSKFQFDKLTETIGFGLRFDTPVGPIRVDYGYLLNAPNGVGHSAVHLSFGQAF